MRNYGDVISSLALDQELSMIREGLTFDDVLLVPAYSDIESRSTGVTIATKLDKLEFDHPIIPANMKSITGRDMAYVVVNSGGLAILHRFMPIEEQFDIAEDIIDSYGSKKGAKHFAISVGVKESDKQNIENFSDIGVRILCIDIAHGDSIHSTRMIKWIKENHPEMYVIAGNVATGAGARRLWEAGADTVKVGVGPGSLCTTRIETGNGVPQLTALMDVANEQYLLRELDKTRGLGFTGRSYSFISDGGIKNAGDIVKALCYADMVMIGNLFAGCEETPGQILSMDGRTYKEYAGSSTHKANHVEGVIALVPSKGSFESILLKLTEGVRSGLSYQGSHNLAELRDNPEFIRITNAGLRESHPHDVTLK